MGHRGNDSVLLHIRVLTVVTDATSTSDDTVHTVAMLVVHSSIRVVINSRHDHRESRALPFDERVDTVCLYCPVGRNGHRHR